MSVYLILGQREFAIIVYTRENWNGAKICKLVKIEK